MSDREREDGSDSDRDRNRGQNRERDSRHRFSEGTGFGDPYDEFDLDPPELDVDPGKVDPVDSRVVADMLDERQQIADDVDAGELLEVGLNYVGINRYEQATEAFERAATYTDDDGLAQEAWTNKGVAHAELEEWDAATAETNLAYALWEYGESAQALEHAERAVEIDPRFPQAWYNRAFFLQERGLSEDALNAIDNAVRLGLRDATVLEEKAQILEDLGEYDEAEQVAEEAEQLREEAEARMIEAEDRERTRIDE